MEVIHKAGWPSSSLNARPNLSECQSIPQNQHVSIIFDETLPWLLMSDISVFSCYEGKKEVAG